MWKVLHCGCLLSIPVSGFEAGASPLGWADLRQCMKAANVHHRPGLPKPINGKTLVPSSCFSSTSYVSCPPQSTERFLKLALQNRKCRFTHVWTRWLVHNEATEGLDLICVSLNNCLCHILVYPSAKDLAQGWEHGGVGSGLGWNNRSCVSTAWLKGMNERIYLNLSMSIIFIY